jgi:hypothetical protein
VFRHLSPLTCPHDDLAINPASTIPEAATRQLRFGQRAPTKLIPLLGDFVVDALVFEFMGLAMLGLCVIVLAVPSGRQPARRVRNN